MSRNVATSDLLSFTLLGPRVGPGVRTAYGRMGRGGSQWARSGSVRELEAREQLSEQRLELPDLVGVQPLEELTVACRERGHGGIDGLEPRRRQLDDHP